MNRDTVERHIQELRKRWETGESLPLIDLHAHLLPGLDDGPRDMQEALDMAREAGEAGVQLIVASPHTMNGIYTVTREEVIDAVARLQAATERLELGLLILPGTELHLVPDPLKVLQEGKALAIAATRHLIMELPTTQVPSFAAEILFRLQLGGYTPVINHPERNREIQRKPDRFEALARAGASAMLTAGSILGDFGSRAQRTARRFLEDGRYEFLVSDAHGFGGRTFSKLPAAVRAAARIIGRERAEALVTRNPARLLVGEGTEP